MTMQKWDYKVVNVTRRGSGGAIIVDGVEEAEASATCMFWPILPLLLRNALRAFLDLNDTTCSVVKNVQGISANFARVGLLQRKWEVFS